MPRILRILAPGFVALFSFGALYLSLLVGGGADPLPLGDPGAVVRWGLPIARFLNDVGLTVTLGSLALTAFAISRKWQEFRKALDLAAMAAVLWTVAAAATAFFTFMSITGLTPASGNIFHDALWQFFTEIEVGQLYVIVVLVAAVVSVLTLLVQSFTGVFWVLLLTIVGIYPLAEMGHAAGAASHDLAVTGLLLHLLGAAVWMGGLATIVILGFTKNGRLHTVLSRFSSVALICFIVVAFSGVASAAVRVGSVTNLFDTRYGWLVIAKLLFLGVLGVFGLFQRNWVIRRIAAAHEKNQNGRVKGWFWYIVVTELAFMGGAAATGTSLARTAPPIDDTATIPNATPAQFLTGEALPPVPTAENFFLLWRLDLLWMLATIFAVTWYLWGVIRLHRRGDQWPWLRTVSFIAGMAIFFYSTNGGLNVYEKYLFSVHMMQHMTLGMMVPVLLVPAAPITLALRAIHKRNDGSMGMREWFLWMVQSKWLRIVGHPIVAAAIFALSLWVFYYSPTFRFATENHLGHIWMVVHFSIAGFLFVQSLIGIDPVHYRPPYPLRLLLLLGTMAFHAFFGLGIMIDPGLMLADWYGAMGWGWDALEDQKLAGGIAWSIGEIPTLFLAIGVAIAWSRTDAKQAKRSDERARRTDDAELREYNERLARLAARDNSDN